MCKFKYLIIHYLLSKLTITTLLFLFSHTLYANWKYSVTPTIIITASVKEPICPGTSVTFIAAISNGGTAPSYEWKKNYNTVGTNSSTYTDNTLINGDIIICVLASNDPTASPPIVYSNYISIIINDGQAPTITTIAGCEPCSPGTGGPAVNAGIYGITYFCLDSKGNIYIDESIISNKIRRIDATTGIINLVTGQDTINHNPPPDFFSGDGGPAVDARVAYPKGLCVDSHDNLIFVDAHNYRIRKIDNHTGIITTMAGTGGINSTGDGGPAINATFNEPSGICIDSADNIYIMESYSRRIRRIDGATGIITTVAQLGGALPDLSSTHYEPREYICIGPCGDLYITTYEGHLIRKINPTTGVITAVAGLSGVGFGFSGDNGPALNAVLNRPWGLNFDKWGNLYVCDLGNNRIRKISAGTGIISTIAGNDGYISSGDGGPAINATLSANDIIVDKAANLYLADSYSIRKITSEVANLPSIAISIIAPDSIICVGNSKTLNLTQYCDTFYGLNAAKEFRWYANSCGGTLIGTGNSITVSPSTTTTYFVRGEGNCLTPGPCTSKTIYAYPPLAPTLNVNVNPGGQICRGSTMKFTANASNGGSVPIYQWKRNGINIGTDSSIFISNSLSNGDVITCQVVSNAPCATPASATSNPVNVSFFPDNISISPRRSPICVGGSLQINASGGLAYQWYRNGVAIAGAMNPTYTAFQDGNYLVRVTNVNCVIPDSCIVALDIPPAVVNPASGSVCVGGDKLLTADGGISYQWYMNGSIIPGAISNTYSATQPGIYMAQVSDGICTAPSNNAVLNLVAAPNSKRYPTVRVATNKPYPLQARNIGQNYLWSPPTALDNPAISNPFVTTAQDMLYTITISSAADPCAYVDTVFVQVFDKPAVYVPSAFTPNGDGKNDELKPIPVHIKNLEFFRIYNRWGEVVFQTSTLEKGWNGETKGVPQPAGVYVWFYEAKDMDGVILSSRGTTMLIR